MGYGNLNNVSGIGMLGMGSGTPQTTTPPSPPFSPASISGLMVWLDASIGVFSDAFLSPAQSGAGVQQWNDQSGNAHHVTQATASLRPIYTILDQNGLPTIKFDGADDFLQAAAFTMAQPSHIFMVLKQITWSGNDCFTDGTSVNTMQLVQDIGTASPNLAIYAGSQVATNPNLPLQKWGVVDALFNGANSALRVNNGVKSAGSAGAASPGGLTVGAAANGSAGGNVSIGEIAMYNVAISDANAALIISYLITKWGIVL